MGRRSKWEIYIDILKAAVEKCSKITLWSLSRLPYGKVNTRKRLPSSCVTFNDYVRILVRKQMLVVSKEANNTIMQTTEKGLEFLDRFHAMTYYWDVS